MTITYIGHSCFRLEHNGFCVVLDPYQNGKVPGLDDINEKADKVLCSHSHDDHNADKLIGLSGREVPFEISCFETYHDDAKGTKRGMNKVHIIKTDGLKIVHLGDIGCKLTPEQLKLLSGADLLMIPVGGFYTIDACQAIEMARAVNAKTVIPMHFRNGSIGFDEIATVDGFLDGFDKEEILYTDSSYVLDNHKVVVMTPKNKR